MYYVTTDGGNLMGPYESYAEAWYSALENFGLEGWVITEIQRESREEA